MLLVTHWEREYQDAVQGGDASPVASLVQEYAATAPDSVSLLRLPPILGLEPMVTSRLPGLTPEQLARLTQRAGGNPQFLDEMVRLALDARSRPWFEGRDTSAAMTERGLATLLAKSVDLIEVAAARFAGSPEEVQKALVLAGLQGAEFLRAVVARMAQSLEPGGAPEHELEAALDAAASQHGYVAPLGLGQAAFRQRLYQEVAKEFLPAFYDEDEAVAELRTVVKDALHGNWDIELGEGGEPELWRLAVELFESSDDSEERRMAAQGLYRLSMFTSLRGELQVAHEQARRLAALLDELPDDRLDPNLGWLRSVNDALAFMGDTAAQRPVLSRLLRLTGEAFEDDVNTWSASMYTEALLDVAEYYDRVGKGDLRQEALATAAAAMQSLDGFEPDVEALETALRLHRDYGAYYEEQGQRGDAHVLYSHALELARQLSTIDDGPRRRFEAARMLSVIGSNALYAGDTATGRRDLEAAVHQLRELVAAFPGVTLEIHVVTALDGLAEAHRREGDYRRAEEMLEEVLGIMRRHREMAPDAAGTLSNLADALERLLELRRALGKPGVAWREANEAVDLRRRALELAGTARERYLLGFSLVRAAEVAGRNGFVDEGYDLSSEALTLLRGVWAEDATPLSGQQLFYGLVVALPFTLQRSGVAATQDLLAESDALQSALPGEALEHMRAVRAALERQRAKVLEAIGDHAGASRALAAARTVMGEAGTSDPPS